MKNLLLYAIVILFLFIFPTINGKDIYFKHLSVEDGLSQPSAISIWQDSLGCMWFGNNILNRYDGNNIKNYRLSDYINDIQNVNVKQIMDGNKNTLYILANSNLVIYNSFYDSFYNTNIETECIYVHDSTLYLGQKNKIAIYNVEKKILNQVYEIPDIESNIKAIYSSDGKRFWIGTDKGLYLVDDYKTSKLVISSENISCIFPDSRNNLWIGTTNNGIRIIKYGSSDIITFNESNPLSK